MDDDYVERLRENEGDVPVRENRKEIPRAKRTVYDIAAGTKLRIKTTEGLDVIGELCTNPKETDIKDVIDIFNCYKADCPEYVVPDTIIRLFSRDILKLEMLTPPADGIIRPCLLVMNCFIVTTETQLRHGIDVIKKECSPIGICFHGKGIGRCGEVHWISFNLKYNFITLDMKALNAIHDDQTIWPILKEEIFENKSILKVFHNVRPIADVLFHQHYIKMQNVYDVQLAELYIRRFMNPEDYKDVKDASGNIKIRECTKLKPLHQLLREYLGDRVNPYEIQGYKSFEENMQSNTSMLISPYDENPNATYIEISVKYLLELRRIFFDSFYVHFNRCMDSSNAYIFAETKTEMVAVTPPHAYLPQKLPKATMELLQERWVPIIEQSD